jgi:hypothetical protein
LAEIFICCRIWVSCSARSGGRQPGSDVQPRVPTESRGDVEAKLNPGHALQPSAIERSRPAVRLLTNCRTAPLRVEGKDLQLDRQIDLTHIDARWHVENHRGEVEYARDAGGY